MVIYLKVTKTQTEELNPTKSRAMWAERQNKTTSNIGHNNMGNMYLSYNKAIPGQNIRDLRFAI